MKFRKLGIILVVFVLLLTFSCVNVFAADVTLTWSSISVPGDAHTEAMKVFKEEVESLSAGHITVDLYIAGAIYTQEGELAACRRPLYCWCNLYPGRRVSSRSRRNFGYGLLRYKLVGRIHTLSVYV